MGPKVGTHLRTVSRIGMHPPDADYGLPARTPGIKGPLLLHRRTATMPSCKTPDEPCPGTIPNHPSQTFGRLWDVSFWSSSSRRPSSISCSPDFPLSSGTKRTERTTPRRHRGRWIFGSRSGLRLMCVRSDPPPYLTSPVAVPRTVWVRNARSTGSAFASRTLPEPGVLAPETARRNSSRPSLSGCLASPTAIRPARSHPEDPEITCPAVGGE